MKLNIGAGYKRFPDFLNVDHDPLTKPDFLCDLEDLYLDMPDNTVEYVIAHHILEHIGPGFFNMLKEIYRVCKHDAIIDIKVPHHRSEMYYCDPTHVRPITVDMMHLFSKKYNQWHIDTYNSSSGFGLKLNIDLEVVDFRYQPTEKWAKAFEHMTNEEIEEVVQERNNVFSEVCIIMKVIKDERSVSDS